MNFALIFKEKETGNKVVFFRHLLYGSWYLTKKNPDGKTDIDLTREYLEEEYGLSLDAKTQEYKPVSEEEIKEIKVSSDYTVFR